MKSVIKSELVNKNYVLINVEDWDQIKDIYDAKGIVRKNYVYIHTEKRVIVFNKKCYIKKKFNAEQIKLKRLKRNFEGRSIRNALFKFKCSNRTIQQIKKKY